MFLPWKPVLINYLTLIRLKQKHILTIDISIFKYVTLEQHYKYKLLINFLYTVCNDPLNNVIMLWYRK